MLQPAQDPLQEQAHFPFFRPRIWPITMESITSITTEPAIKVGRFINLFLS